MLIQWQPVQVITYVFVEKLDLVFQHAVLVEAHCGVRRLAGNVFEKRVHSNTLDKFSVAFESLNFCKLVLGDAPDD